MEELKPLGLDLSQRLIDVLGGDAQRIAGFGKAAIVGGAGELEHGALWHVPGGYAMRERLGDAKAIVPSTKQVAGPAPGVAVPIPHINAPYLAGHLDTVKVRVRAPPAAAALGLILPI